MGISPMVGYILSNKFWVGMQVGYNSSKLENNVGVKTTNSDFNFVPFVRYFALRHNKFALSIKGSTSVSFGTKKVDDNVTEDSHMFGLNIIVSPIVTYDMNDRLTFKAGINGLNFGYSYITEKQDSQTKTYSDFNFGMNTGSLFTAGAVTVGVVVKL